jgi:branched-subunit amino acid transport protein
MNLWLAMILSGAATYATRLSFILLWERLEVPPLLRQALRFVPVAVLTAIIFPETLMPAGSLDLSLGNARLIAGLLAVIVAWRTKNIVWTIVVGMLGLWGLQYMVR